MKSEEKNMHINIKSILNFPFTYRLWSNFVISKRKRNFFIKEHIRPVKGYRFLDIGCGTGDIIKHLPDIDYIGFDMNKNYIDSAKKRFGKYGTFLCKKLSNAILNEFSLFDIVLADGILHHLDDSEALQLFEFAYKLLKKTGRLITKDGCYINEQSKIVKFILSKDRGYHVRTKEDYLSLATKFFPNVKVSIYNNLLRIPYTHIIMECSP